MDEVELSEEEIRGIVAAMRNGSRFTSWEKSADGKSVVAQEVQLV